MRDWKQIGVVCITLLLSALTAAEAMPPNIWYDFGDDHGLCCSDGKEILPVEYPEVKHLGNGFFLVSERAEGANNRYNLSGTKFIIDSTGKRIPTPIPPNTHLQNILWLNKKENVDSKAPIKLAGNALIVIEQNQLLGLCDFDGKEVLSPEYRRIGHFNDSVAFLRSENGHAFLFNAVSGVVIDIQSLNIDESCMPTFSEGIAAFSTRSRTVIDLRFGFMDTHGKIVVPPVYATASNFSKGLALVTDPPVFGKTYLIPYDIDKHFKRVSPPNLYIQEFQGDYAIATLGAEKFGVVDRNFKFVIKPAYERILPQAPPSYSEDDLYSRNSRNPLCFYAIPAKAGALPVVLSLQGEELFALPNNSGFPDHRPHFHDGLIECNLDVGTPAERKVYLDLQGSQQASLPFSGLFQPNVSYDVIAPGVLKKTIHRERPKEENTDKTVRGMRFN